MKQLFSLLIIFLPLTLFSQIYVDENAGGTNDGSTWGNAFILVEDAIEAAQDGDEIWIAFGSYEPPIADIDDTDTIRTWVIDKKISIHGSFNGNETSKDQRDLSFPTTILNGDILNDDNLDDPFENREDNARHLFFITDTVDNSTIIDGLYIINGTTLPASGSGNNRRGGGILSYGAPIIENCYFQHCRGHYASAVYPRGGGSSGTIIRNCSFLENHATQSGSIYLVSNRDITIEDCRFKNNTTDTRAGGVYVSGTENCNIIRCSFEENKAETSTGGGIHCTNEATVNVSNCSFKNNKSRWGASITVYQEGSVVSIDSCEFAGNTATTSGGGISIGFKGRANVNNSSFTNNEAEFGGAVYLQNDSSEVHITNSALNNNTVQNSGGAIYSGAGIKMSLTDCALTSNTADNFGGAINVSEDSLDLLEVTIDRCSFISNIGSAQGGAINVSEGNVDITNSIFAFNDSNGAGRGGVLSNNSNGEDNKGGSTVTFTNCSMYANTGLEAGGISQWSPDSGNAVVVFANTIMQTDIGSPLYFVEEGNPTVISNGGNIVSDNTFAAEFTKTNDLLNTDPLFADPFSLDFTPGENSPAIGNAVANLAPELDFNGEKRSDMPESGAVEYDPLSAIFNTTLSEANISISPTLASDEITITFEDYSSQNTWTMSVVDQQGKIMVNHQKVNSDRYKLNIGNYLSGQYYVLLISRKGQYVGHFMKIEE